MTGYFTHDATGSTYHALSPTRLLDTRSGNGLSGAFHANIARTFQVTGLGRRPSCTSRRDAGNFVPLYLLPPSRLTLPAGAA